MALVCAMSDAENQQERWVSMRKMIAVVYPRALRPDAAAAYLSTTPRFIEDLLRAGDLPYRILGKARVIEIADLDAYMASIPKQTGRLPGRGVNLESVDRTVNLRAI
jgi:excisionase family DNA binding protein